VASRAARLPARRDPSLSPTTSTNGARRSRARNLAIGIPATLAAALALSIAASLAGSKPESDEIVGSTVRRGPLRISVTASGSLRAAETVRLTSAIEGRTTVLFLAPEGAQVREGDLVCELDATAMVEKRIQQSISAGTAEAGRVEARQALEIQKSQNRSDLDKARRAVDFAAMDLQLFLEGERDFQLDQAKQAIDLAREEAQRAQTRLAWSRKLGERGFLTATELEADSIAAHRADIELEQATRELDLQQRFRLPKREAELKAAHEEAKLELERVELQAQARLVDFESDLRTAEATCELEREKLARLEDQIAKAKLRAPRAGYVVYAQRDSDEPPIQEGAEVREREEILSIPSSAGMIGGIKLHESVLDQVQVGQPCTIRFDALPGVTVDGTVAFVAMLPDRNSRWSNPNLRVYATDIAIATPHPGLRPGMSCAVEILVEELGDAVYVPVQSVFRDRHRNFAFVRTGAGILQREVRVGRHNDLWVQILDGLEAGDTVLLDSPAGFEPSEPEGEEQDDAPPREKGRDDGRDDASDKARDDASARAASGQR
jgi:HlyD family secretion protein